MCDVVLLSVFDSGYALLLVYQFTHIFIHKLSLSGHTKEPISNRIRKISFVNFQKPETLTFLISRNDTRPQPLPAVRMILVSG